MTDRQALLAAIIAHPDEDTPRLAFADFLDEQGDTFFADWAALIRTQIEFARIERFSPRWLELAHEQVRLFNKRKREWSPLWRSRLGPVARRRGFREADFFDVSESRFREKLDRAFAVDPLRATGFGGLAGSNRQTLVWLIQHPGMARVGTLDVSNNKASLTRKFLNRITSRMPRLRVLGLRSLGLTAREAGDLLATLAIPGLRALDLSDNRLCFAELDDNRPEFLLHSPALAGLEWLDLYQTRLTPEAVHVLAHSPTIHALRYLDLGTNPYPLDECPPFGPEGAEALAHGPSVRGVEVLKLVSQRIGSRGIAALVQSPLMATVRELDLTGNNLGDEGLVALAASPRVTALRRLDLGGEPLTAVGAKALIESPYLARLSILNQDEFGTGVHHQPGSPLAALRERFPGRSPQSSEINGRCFIESVP